MLTMCLSCIFLSLCFPCLCLMPSLTRLTRWLARGPDPWNRPKIWSKCARTPLSRWFIISRLIAFPNTPCPAHTHTHNTHYKLCFLDKSRFQSEGERERESRSCCNLEPTLSLSSLCRLSPPIARPATWSTLILRWTWLYDPSLCRLSSESFDYSNPRRYLEIHCSWKTRKQFKLLNLRPLHLCAFAVTRSKL